MRTKIFIFITLLCVCLSSSIAYADNTGEAVGEAAGGVTPSNSISDSIGAADGSSTNIVNSYNDMFSKMGDPSSNNTAQSTSATVAPIISSFLGFFIVLIPLMVLLYTALELACIFIKPLRPLCGAEGGGGSMGDGNNKKFNFLQVSEDCIAVIGGSGGGDMSGGGKKGVGDMAIEYLKLRMKTLVICFVILALFLTPFGSAIILKIVQLIMNIISKVAGFI